MNEEMWSQYLIAIQCETLESLLEAMPSSIAIYELRGEKVHSNPELQFVTCQLSIEAICDYSVFLASRLLPGFQVALLGAGDLL